MTQKILSVMSALLVASALLVTPAFAEDEYHSINVRSELKGFSQNDWKDDLSNNDILFTANDKLQGRFTVTNYGNRNETQLKVTITVPETVTIDIDKNLTIPEVAVGGSYSKLYTITFKDKTAIKKATTANIIKFDVKAESGTSNVDQSTFYSANGTKGTSTATNSGTTKGGLPATGAASTLLFGTAIASALGYAALKLRSFARGY